MDSLGPAPASRLEPLRSGERESRQRDPRATPPKTSSSAPAKRGGDSQADAELESTEETHQLDERA